MNVTVELGATVEALRLEQPDEFRSFALLIIGDGGEETIAQALLPIGRLLDAQTAMLEIDAVTRLPGARAEDPEWRASFDAMIQYAERHGWVDDDRRCVQAHCERR